MYNLLLLALECDLVVIKTILHSNSIASSKSCIETFKP